MNCQPDKLCELMVGFFDGSIEGVWEPTLIGDYQWHGETPKKGFVPRDEWVHDLKWKKQKPEYSTPNKMQ